MKILSFVLLLLLGYNSYAQTSDNNKTSNDLIKEFTWDVQKEEKGAMMFLDVAYQRENSDSTEYLTLTVAKDKTKQRPDFISVIIPSNVTQSNGIFITFAKIVTTNGEQRMELQKAKPVRINFETCKDATCTARVIDGYAKQENGDCEDIFQKFLTYAHVL